MIDFLYVFNKSPLQVVLSVTAFFIILYFFNEPKPGVKHVLKGILLMIATIYMINAIFVIARMVFG